MDIYEIGSRIGEDVAPGVTGNALMREFSSLKEEVVAQGDQLVEELECLERELEAQKGVSSNVLLARSSVYLQRMEQWKAEQPEMPKERTCTVCGAIWIQEEHHDRGTTLSKWSLGSLHDAS
ncbi:MAG: hypothetical protein AB7K71_18535 [Polyangiaceae bacterium]